MKHLFKKSLLVFLAITFFIAPASVFAQSMHTDRERIVTLGKEEIIEHDYFTAGSKVYIDGTVNGDAYIAGGQVDINGTIKGDLLVAGGEVTIRGTVMQNVRAIGGTVVITGTVGRNVSVAGGSVTIEKEAKVNGNTALAAGSVSLLSPVKNVTLAAGDVSFSSIVTGNVVAAAQTIQLYSGSKITGDMTYWSDTEAQVAKDASISGAVSFNQTNFKSNMDRSQEKARNAATGFGVVIRLISFCSALIIGLLFIKLMPVFSAKTAEMIHTRLGKSMLYGFIVIIVLPFAALLLMITLIGIPVAVALLFAYAALIYLSKIFLAMAIGSVVAKSTKWKLSLGWSFLVGISIFYLLAMIPVVAFFVKLVSLFAGVGALVLTKKEYFNSLRSKKII